METNSIKQLFDQLPNYYSELSEITHYEKVDKGMANLNFVVTTSENKYFLKIIPETQKTYLPRQISFYENIAKVAVGTISPVKNKADKFITEFNGNAIMLYPFKEIIEPVMDVNNAQTIGELVGALHSVTVSEDELERSRYTKAFYQEGLLSVDPSRIERYTAYAKYIDSLANDLPKGFVFDDICPDNLYADSNGIHGFIDPENAGYGEYIFDIAGAFIMSFYGRDNQDELMKAFLNGYSMKRDLTEREKDSLFESSIFVCVLLALFFEIKSGEKNVERINLRLSYIDELISLGKEDFHNRFFAV